MAQSSLCYPPCSASAILRMPAILYLYPELDPYLRLVLYLDFLHRNDPELCHVHLEVVSQLLFRLLNLIHATTQCLTFRHNRLLNSRDLQPFYFYLLLQRSPKLAPCLENYTVARFYFVYIFLETYKASPVKAHTPQHQAET